MRTAAARPRHGRCLTLYAGNENKVSGQYWMIISPRAGIDLMPRTNHRVIPGAPGLYAAEIRSVVVWLNRGLSAIFCGICHAPRHGGCGNISGRPSNPSGNQANV